MLEALLNLGLLAASLAALLFVADKLINHSIRLAKILGVSGAVIGLTLLAYGTSLPEFAVSSVASYWSHDELSVSNIVGSNIYNVTMVLGIAAFLVPFAWKDDLRRDGLFMIAVTLLLIPFGLAGGIPQVAGIGLVALLAAFTYYVLRVEKRKGEKKEKRHKGSARKELGWCVLFLLGVVVAGYFTVQFAVGTARALGVSEWIIGSTIVAAGTSFPETVVSIMSARKREMGMSIGNIVGSNYFNILLVLGSAAAISPLAFSLQAVWMDFAFVLGTSGLLLFALFRKRVTRVEGALYIALYVLFVVYLLRLLPFG
jgi:cation:H+ antiporter